MVGSGYGHGSKSLAIHQGLSEVRGTDI
jgi:hypothetical protein